MAPKRKTSETPMDFTVMPLSSGLFGFRVVGTSPMIFNAVSNKSKQTLLLPRGRLTAAEKLSRLKHEPLKEYRNSTYRFREDKQPTRLYFPGGGFKKSLSNAAKRIPGITGKDVDQLTWVNEIDVGIYGVPQLFMAVTRSADISRTPDVRTRAILPQWAAMFTVRYVRPQLTDASVINLVNAAGMLCGVGDNRQEKGGGHGQFQIVTESQPETVEQFESITSSGGREAQDEALENPTMFDGETAELFEWYTQEVAKLGDRFAKVEETEEEEEETEKVEAAA